MLVLVEYKIVDGKFYFEDFVDLLVGGLLGWRIEVGVF